MSRKIAIPLCILAAGSSLLAPSVEGLQINSERRTERQAESEAPQSVSGGATFQLSVPVERAYNDLLNWAKREGLVLTSASRETGQIVTEIQVTGGYRQTGTRVYLTTIRDGDAQTTIRVAVSEQKRFKALTTEAWGSPKVNAEKSRELAQKIQAQVKVAPPDAQNAGAAQGGQPAAAPVPGPAATADAPLSPIAPPPPPADEPQAPPQSISLGQTPDQVVAILGQPQKIVDLGAKKTYIYKDMKVVFTNGKMTDAQ